MASNCNNAGAQGQNLCAPNIRMSYRVWRERVRLQMRKAMREQGWISEGLMLWGYEAKTDAGCKRCGGSGELVIGWQGGGKVYRPCDCTVAVYVSVWRRMWRKLNQRKG